MKTLSQSHSALLQTEGQIRIQRKFPNAREVYIAGTFNHWEPNSIPLKKLTDHDWQIEFILPPGAYEYRFIVDGKWMSDAQSVTCIPNPYGDFNSIFVVSVHNSAEIDEEGMAFLRLFRDMLELRKFYEETYFPKRKMLVKT